MEKKPKGHKDKLYKQWQFIAGVVGLGCGQIANGLAIALGNIILIASTSCLTIVFAAIFSPILLKEKFSCKLDGLTIFMVASGSLIAVS